MFTKTTLRRISESGRGANPKSSIMAEPSAPLVRYGRNHPPFPARTPELLSSRAAFIGESKIRQHFQSLRQTAFADVTLVTD